MPRSNRQSNSVASDPFFQFTQTIHLIKVTDINSNILSLIFYFLLSVYLIKSKLHLILKMEGKPWYFFFIKHPQWNLLPEVKSSPSQFAYLSNYRKKENMGIEY